MSSFKLLKISALRLCYVASKFYVTLWMLSFTPKLLPGEKKG
ncbi:hypothetical protein THF1D04_50147 [Vibrio owensii]|uniref:Acetyltransferase n=1 Tax=Vibrio owensii TaxID=696485 RepID=A0AAU9Q9V1_9VIBR|nr:hypothetical protein THF1D04_50147 [Vibrio owensii]